MLWWQLWLLLHNCNFATLMNHNVNICVFWWSQAIPVKRLFRYPKGSQPTVRELPPGEGFWGLSWWKRRKGCNLHLHQLLCYPYHAPAPYTQLFPSASAPGPMVLCLFLSSNPSPPFATLGPGELLIACSKPNVSWVKRDMRMKWTKTQKVPN